MLVVDRATFPSDTVSTHYSSTPKGVAALRRWGVLDQVVVSGLPARPPLLDGLPAHHHRLAPPASAE